MPQDLSSDAGNTPAELAPGNSDTLPEYLTTREAAAILRMPKSLLNQWRHYNYGPPYIKLRRRILYPRQDLQHWLRNRFIRPSRGQSSIGS